MPLAAAEPAPDPRPEAFLRLLRASDRCDTRGTVAAIRELRSHGWSVVPTGKGRR